MTSRHLVAAALLSLASSLVAESVVAQTVSAPTVDRRSGRTLVAPANINREDCLADEVMTFTLPIDAAGMNLTAYNIAVWVGAGSDCTDEMNRTGADPICWRVAQAMIQLPNMSILVNVRDVIGGVTVDGTTETSETVCTPESQVRAETPVTLFFMIVNNAGTALTGSTPASWEGHYDVVGPPQPTDVHAGIGEEALVVTWNEPENVGPLDSYKVCWEALGAAPLPDDGTGAGGAGPDGGVEEDAGVNPANCTSVNLVPGDPPREGVRCRVASGANAETGEASPLTNGVRYVVAVAAVNDFENAGDLSNLQCGTPEPVTGFFEAYRAAGGGGGGGYCAVGATASRLSAVGVALAGFGLLLRRLKKQSERAKGRRAA